MINIYTDGACSGNGKANSNGGCGFVAIEDDRVIKLYSKRAVDTTNNREELKAIWAAMQFAGDREATIFCDSAYCLNTIVTWMYGWANKGWRKAKGDTPENLDLIKPIYDHMQFRTNLSFVKVKGHSNDIYNEIADALATDNKTKLNKFINLTKV